MMNRISTFRVALALFAVTITLSALTGCETKATVASTGTSTMEKKDGKDYKGSHPLTGNTNPHNGH